MPGAIAVTDMVEGADLEDRIARVGEMFERYLGRRPEIDRAVWSSERETGNRNRAIAYLMLSHGIIGPRVEETLDLYFGQCSVLVTAADLALIGATLANYGVNPRTGEQDRAGRRRPRHAHVALTCGMYDYAGEWAYTVGVPAKSGVGGGILGCSRASAASRCSRPASTPTAPASAACVSSRSSPGSSTCTCSIRRAPGSGSSLPLSDATTTPPSWRRPRVPARLIGFS